MGHQLVDTLRPYGQALPPTADPQTAQRVIDTALQLHGGDGVRKGMAVESLYREIRALRIYEGATDVQKVVIAREMSRELKLLVAAQPTRGVDVGSIEFIHKRIIETRDAGIPVVVVST